MADAQPTTNVTTDALPPAAPKPQQSGANPSDSQGVRTHDQDSVKPHVTDAPPGRKKKTAPRSTNPRPLAPTQSPVNDLRIASRLRPSRPVQHPDINWFIPSFTMLFSVLGSLCDKTCALRSFGERGTVNNWIPQSAFLVYGLLAIIQVYRAQKLTGLITPEQSLFLDFFLSQFPLETIVIPGPLIPFFRSLSVTNPGFGNFEDVTPAIPPLSFDEEYVYRLVFGTANIEIGAMLPHIPFMYAEFIRLISFALTSPATGVRAKFGSFTQINEFFGTTAGTAGNKARGTNSLRMSVAFAYRPTMADALLTRFSDYLLNHAQAFPAPWSYDAAHAYVPGTPGGTAPTPSQWTEYSGTSDFFMMTDSINWFSILLRGQDSFLNHWKGNATLASIAPTSSTAPLLKFSGITWATAPTQNVFTTASSLNNSSGFLQYAAACKTTCPFISQEDYDDAQVAMVNIETTGSGTTTVGAIGSLNGTRFGDFWSVTPDVDQTDTIDINAEIRSLAVGAAYFSAKGINDA